jgi:hypothetical protein
MKNARSEAKPREPKAGRLRVLAAGARPTNRFSPRAILLETPRVLATGGPVPLCWHPSRK